MRAIQVREFGGPEVLVAREVADPVAGPGQLVVAIAAADVIFLDTLLRSGWGQEYFPLELPYVPGGGGAGLVLSVGEGVDPGWIGRRVLVRGSGGYAERMAAEAAEAVPLPEELGFAEAAALLHDAVTAQMLIGEGRIEKGAWVLVAAAAGGAGSLVVQLAEAAGARVIAAARGGRKRALATELGATLTVDYSEPDWPDRVRAATGGTGVAVAFDGAGGRLGREAFRTVARGGRFLTYGTAEGFADIDPEAARRQGVTVINALEFGSPGEVAVSGMLTRAFALTVRGGLRPVIGARYPLERAAEAHRALAERTVVGKSVLVTGVDGQPAPGVEPPGSTVA
ncbi:zinc-binding dehydrogenase [Streptomyces sp. NPDC048290]|uniref:zinc-binding dehydrogenase n=1 Tax=Streptomyces sp. NPDC048290 TaxID=3155811 RepID=UPI00341C7943